MGELVFTLHVLIVMNGFTIRSRTELFLDQIQVREAAFQ